MQTVTMKEIDALRAALEIERDTFRHLRDHHLGVVDAIERVEKAEAAVLAALAQWWTRDCSADLAEAMARAMEGLSVDRGERCCYSPSLCGRRRHLPFCGAAAAALAA